MKSVKVRGVEYKITSRLAEPFHREGNYISGTTPPIPYDRDTLQLLQDSWSAEITGSDIRTMFVNSRTWKGIVYKVRRVDDDYFCECPARVECWHIRWTKYIWEGKHESEEIGEDPGAYGTESINATTKSTSRNM